MPLQTEEQDKSSDIKQQPPLSTISIKYYWSVKNPTEYIGLRHDSNP